MGEVNKPLIKEINEMLIQDIIVFLRMPRYWPIRIPEFLLKGNNGKAKKNN